MTIPEISERMDNFANKFNIFPNVLVVPKKTVLNTVARDLPFNRITSIMGLKVKFGNEIFVCLCNDFPGNYGYTERIELK